MYTHTIHTLTLHHIYIHTHTLSSNIYIHLYTHIHYIYTLHSTIHTLPHKSRLYIPTSCTLPPSIHSFSHTQLHTFTYTIRLQPYVTHSTHINNRYIRILFIYAIYTEYTSPHHDIFLYYYI